MADRVYCTNPRHGYGEHDQSCVPPADPGDPKLRLLRAIYGLCPDCNVTGEHEHPCRTCGKEQPLPDGSYCYREERK